MKNIRKTLLKIGVFAFMVIGFLAFAQVANAAGAPTNPYNPYNVPPQDTGFATDILYAVGAVSSTVGMSMLATVKSLTNKLQ
jgi:hypothetical protein